MRVRCRQADRFDLFLDRPRQRGERAVGQGVGHCAHSGTAAGCHIVLAFRRLVPRQSRTGRSRGMGRPRSLCAFCITERSYPDTASLVLGKESSLPGSRNRVVTTRVRRALPTAQIDSIWINRTPVVLPCRYVQLCWCGIGLTGARCRVVRSSFGKPRDIPILAGWPLRMSKPSGQRRRHIFPNMFLPPGFDRRSVRTVGDWEWISTTRKKIAVS